MPRPPKPENARNPLRVLREVLSEKGSVKPITQSELSRIILVPTKTITAVESGARNFSRNLSRHIALEIGAFWQEDGENWVWVSGGQKVPYTLDIFKDVNRQRLGRPDDWKEHMEFLHTKLDYLFKLAPDHKWWELRFKLEQCLRECWTSAGVAMPQDVLDFGSGSVREGWGDKRRDHKK